MSEEKVYFSKEKWYRDIKASPLEDDINDEDTVVCIYSKKLVYTEDTNKHGFFLNGYKCMFELCWTVKSWGGGLKKVVPNSPENNNLKSEKVIQGEMKSLNRMYIILFTRHLASVTEWLTVL